MAYSWPTDPKGKKPSHSIPWSQHQANLAAAMQNTTGLGAAAQPSPVAHAGAPIANQTSRAIAAGTLIPGNTGAPQAAPAQPAQPGTPATAPAQIVPDAEYLARAAQAAFQRTTKINQLTGEGTDDRTNTATTINRLIENALSDRQKIGEGANREGLFYSGQLTKRLADYEKQLTRAKDDANTEFGQRQAAREAAIKAIQEGAPIDDAVDLAEAAARQVTRDTSAADLGALAENLSASSIAPTSGAVLGGQAGAIAGLIAKAEPKGYKEVKHPTRKDGVWHVYPDGRKVWVPKRR